MKLYVEAHYIKYWLKMSQEARSTQAEREQLEKHFRHIDL